MTVVYSIEYVYPKAPDAFCTKYLTARKNIELRRGRKVRDGA